VPLRAEQPCVVGDCTCGKEDLADLASPVRLVVLRRRVGQDGLDVDPGDLQRDNRVRVVAQFDLADLRSQRSQLLQQRRPFPGLGLETPRCRA